MSYADKLKIIAYICYASIYCIIFKLVTCPRFTPILQGQVFFDIIQKLFMPVPLKQRCNKCKIEKQCNDFELINNILNSTCIDCSTTEKKICPICQKEFPKHNKYFYYYTKKNQWCSYCRQCDANRVNERIKAKYVHKKRLPKYNIIEKLTVLPPNKLCKYCGNEYPITTEFWYYSDTKKCFELFKCIECRSQASRVAHHKLTYETEESGELPGEFGTEEEKEQVWEFLKALEWKYSSTTNIWYKSGIKSMHNFWEFQKPEYDRNRKKKDYDESQRIT